MPLGAVSVILAVTLLGSAGAWLAARRLRRARQAARSSLDAQVALWRHPAGRARWPERDHPLATAREDPPAPGRPAGPDDDPEFISALERLIHGDHGDPA